MEKTLSSPPRSGACRHYSSASAARRRVKGSRSIKRETCSLVRAPGNRWRRSTPPSRDSAEGFAEQRASFPHHRSVAAKGETDRVDTGRSKGVARRAADALLGE